MTAAMTMPLDLRRHAVTGFALFAILVLWTQAQPFASLSDYGVLDDPAQSNTLRRNLTLLLLGTALWLVWRSGRSALFWRAVSPGLVAIFVWFALVSLLSGAAGLALNRLALAAVVIALAVCLPILLRRLDDYIVLLGLAATLAIVGSFLGAVFVPDLAIHSLKDTVEQGLAGDWRGIFRHKNDLAPMAIHFCFIGLLLLRTGRPFWGAGVMVGSVVLLVLSGGKSAALLLLPAMLAAATLVRLRSNTASTVLVFGLIGGIALVTVGSVAFPAVAAITAHLPDPSFTGRTDIWQLALEAATTRPVTGYGYGIFWDTGATYSLAGSGDTAAQVSHAHNGYLDIAIAAGVPGLLLVLAWTLVAPFRQVLIIRARPLDRTARAFLEYLVASWLFTLMISCLEAVLFNRGDSIWFTGLLALVCLRFWSREALAQ